MSRIAKNPIKISKDIECSFKQGVFYAKGKLGEMKISVNQKKKPAILDSFQSLGKFHFEKGECDVVRISTDKSNGVVIGDSVRLLEINGLNPPPAITKGDTVKKTDAKSDDRKKELQQNKLLLLFLTLDMLDKIENLDREHLFLQN